MGRITLQIKPVAPFRLDLTAWALRRQPHNRIDLWDGKKYTRVLVVKGTPWKVDVAQENAAGSRLSVVASGPGPADESAGREISGLLRKILGTGEEMNPFYRIADRDPRLSVLAKRFIGLKPPRFPTVFETLINAFACQQLSLNVGLTLLNRLTQAYGAPAYGGNDVLHAFPTPGDLARADQSVLRNLGFSMNKGRAITALARSVLDGTIDLEQLESMHDEEAIAVLRGIAGVGRWSAEYVLLRGLRRLNIFPGDDVGAQNNLRQFLSLREKPDYAGIRRIMRRWEPYQGFVYFHFLLQKLWSKGLLQDGAAPAEKAG